MKNGFTIIEILISIAISIILLAIIVIPFKRMNETQILSKETANVMGVLNNARSQSLSSKGGVSHGVHIESDELVLFSGSVYSPSDPENVSISLNPLVSISNISLNGGVTNVIFDQLTGETTSFGTIRVSLIASTTQNRIITINATGIIDGTP